MPRLCRRPVRACGQRAGQDHVPDPLPPGQAHARAASMSLRSMPRIPAKVLR